MNIEPNKYYKLYVNHTYPHPTKVKVLFEVSRDTFDGFGGHLNDKMKSKHLGHDRYVTIIRGDYILEMMDSTDPVIIGIKNYFLRSKLKVFLNETQNV